MRLGLRDFGRISFALAAIGLLSLGSSRSAYGQAAAGVIINADGVLSTQLFPDPNGALMRQRIAEAKASLSADLQAGSKLRKISLNRLEKAIEAQAAGDRKPTEEMLNLAGLTRIKYVFYYPDSKDIVIAGPAEGWVDDLSGRTVGINSGRPVLELQDLVAALRVYAPGQKGGSVVGCSIDPTQEGLQKMQDFLRQLGGRLSSANDTQYIVDGLRTNLGLQTVRVMGVNPSTHFAQVLVEADYRMKLIGIGLEPSQVKMSTFIDKASPSSPANGLIRWFFVPNYQCLRVAGDGTAMEMVGEGVKLVDENEVVLQGGKRAIAVGEKSRASAVFTTGFTQKYPEISSKKPIYAQLRNLIDMTIAAAFIQQQDYYTQSGWSMPTLMSEEKFPIQTYQAPVQVDTVVTSVWKGGRLMTPVAGGVTIQAKQALDKENQLPDDREAVAHAKLEVVLKDLKPTQWWWD